MNSELLRLSWAHKHHSQHSIWILTSSSFKTVLILLLSPRNADLTSESGAHYKHNYSSTNPHSLSSAAFMNSMTGHDQFPQDQQQGTQIIHFLPTTERRKSYPVVQLNFIPERNPAGASEETHLQHQWLWYQLHARGWCSSNPGFPLMLQRGI